jgi:hypothetical protein
MVDLKLITCSNEVCKKEFAKPVVVANHMTLPSEAYFACPYCLTRIDLTKKVKSKSISTVMSGAEKEEIEESSFGFQVLEGRPVIEKSESESEGLVMPQGVADDSVFSPLIIMEKIEKLRKEKADLSMELNDLRRAAKKRISVLEREVAELRKEKESLRELENSFK